MTAVERAPALTAIGTRIRQRRQERLLTQEQLATAAGLSKSFVSELEGGHASASGLVYLKLATALEVEVQWLLLGRQRQNPPPPRATNDVPPAVEELAKEFDWSYYQTIETAAALHGIVARRTDGGSQIAPSRDLIIAIAEAVRRDLTK